MNLITDSLQKLANAVTVTQPVMALGGLSGEPTFFYASKGQKKVDDVWFSSGGANGAISGTSTDTAPALAIVDVYLVETLYLAWKVAGSNTVKVLQNVLGEDGFPVAEKWEALPVSAGQSCDPGASTDAAPALAVGANNALYLVWKTPGNDAPIEWSVYNGSEWSAPAAIPTAWTNMSPALAGWNTSGPGNVFPLCLAWIDATTDGVFWAQFAPGSGTFSPNQVPAALSDAAPAVAAGPFLGKSFYLVWKTKGKDSLACATVSDATSGDTYTLPQVHTHLGPAAVNDLTLCWADQTTGDIWRGDWTIVSNPAQYNSLGSNSNYILSDNCKNLTEISVTIEITQAIDSTGGIGFQLNAYSPLPHPIPPPPKQYVTWQQYIMQCAVNRSNHLEIKGHVENWPQDVKSGGQNLYNFETPVVHTVPGKNLPAGYKLIISLGTDSATSKVNSAKFTVIDDAGKNHHKTAELTSGYLWDRATNSNSNHHVTLAEMAPIVAFELDFTAPVIESPTTFSSGMGTFTYAAKNPLKASNGEPPCAQPQGWGTGETSDSLYGVLPASPSTTLVQTFCVNP